MRITELSEATCSCTISDLTARERAQRIYLFIMVNRYIQRGNRFYRHHLRQIQLGERVRLSPPGARQHVDLCPRRRMIDTNLKSLSDIRAERVERMGRTSDAPPKTSVMEAASKHKQHQGVRIGGSRCSETPSYPNGFYQEEPSSTKRLCLLRMCA